MAPGPVAEPGTTTSAGGDALAAGMARVEALIGWQFRKPELLREALTHRSAAHEMPASTAKPGQRGGRLQAGRKGVGSNERLEFIGDRVLGLVVA